MVSGKYRKLVQIGHSLHTRPWDSQNNSLPASGQLSTRFTFCIHTCYWDSRLIWHTPSWNLKNNHFYGGRKLVRIGLSSMRLVLDGHTHALLGLDHVGMCTPFDGTLSWDPYNSHFPTSSWLISFFTFYLHTCYWDLHFERTLKIIISLFQITFEVSQTCAHFLLVLGSFKLHTLTWDPQKKNFPPSCKIINFFPLVSCTLSPGTCYLYTLSWDPI